MSCLRTGLSFVFAITILSQCSPLWAENAVPVVIWGDLATSNSETTGVNPFVKITSDKFNEILCSILEGRPPVLVLLVDNLCVEDIVRYRKEFQKVIHDAKYTYIPLVEQASSAFQELPMYNQTDDVDVESISDGQLLIKSIPNLDSLFDIVSEISNSGTVVILTGKACSYRKSERVKREATADSSELIVGTNRVLFYASQPLLLKTPNGDMKLAPAVVSNDRGEGTPESPVILRMQFDGEKTTNILEFSFEVKTAGYYTLASVEYQADGQKQMMKASSNMVFPFNFSYHCSQTTLFEKDDYQLTIANLQVEIDGEKNRFNDAYDCVGFTTIPIWTGLFVTAILAAIMIWGLSMIIDIRTMDRFDDPKGKTITISTQE